MAPIGGGVQWVMARAPLFANWRIPHLVLRVNANSRIRGGMKENAVLAMLTKACEALGSQQAWAEANNLSPSYVSDVLKGRRAPGQSILAALGLTKAVEYKRIAGYPGVATNQKDNNHEKPSDPPG